MSTRRDYTNQFGAFTPTETQALNNISKKTSVVQPVKKHGDTLREGGMKAMDAKRKSFAQFVNEGNLEKKDLESDNLKKARKFYLVIENIAGMCGFKITQLELRVKGKEEYYKKNTFGMEQGCYETTNHE